MLLQIDGILSTCYITPVKNLIETKDHLIFDFKQEYQMFCSELQAINFFYAFSQHRVIGDSLMTISLLNKKIHKQFLAPI